MRQEGEISPPERASSLSVSGPQRLRPARTTHQRQVLPSPSTSTTNSEEKVASSVLYLHTEVLHQYQHAQSQAVETKSHERKWTWREDAIVRFRNDRSNTSVSPPQAQLHPQRHPRSH